jgi:signal transduction histidine kinase
VYRRAVLLFYVLAVLFFLLVSYLYELEMAPVLYSVLLVSFVLLLWVGVDGYLFWQVSRRLQEVRSGLTGFAPQLPATGNYIEEQYQGIIIDLYALLDITRQEMDADYASRLEYYTMWVHQIKTPIAAMRLAAEDDIVLGQELFKIERYAEMALHYVKLGSLESDLVIDRYKVEEIVRDSVRKYSSLFIGKKLSVSLSNLDQLVLTDSKWLSFILEQVLANAIKYTNAGGVQIYLRDGALVVEDSGIGICDADIQRVFEKGYTGYNGRLDKRASGIGLYMAKRVADSLCIKLRIESQVGVGTKVFMDFPK